MSQFTRTQTTKCICAISLKLLQFFGDIVNWVVEYAFYSRNCKHTTLNDFFVKNRGIFSCWKFNYDHRNLRKLSLDAKQNLTKNSSFRFFIWEHFLLKLNYGTTIVLSKLEMNAGNSGGEQQVGYAIPANMYTIIIGQYSSTSRSCAVMIKGR